MPKRAKGTLWTPHKRDKALTMYVAGAKVADIGKELKIDLNTIRQFVKSIHKGLTNRYATSGNGGTNQWNPQGELRLQNPELINQAFQAVLSPPDAEILTEAELQFIHIYASTNNFDIAAANSGMDAGLFTVKEMKGGKGGRKELTENYSICLKLRVAYLQMKPNIKQKITELRGTSNFDTGQVNREYLQKQIMVEIDALKDAQGEGLIKIRRDYITMLGKTFGGFTEKIEIGMVNHNETVRKLAVVAKGDKDDLAALRIKKLLEAKQDELEKVSENRDD